MIAPLEVPRPRSEAAEPAPGPLPPSLPRSPLPPFLPQPPLPSLPLSLAARVLIALVRGYQWLISPLLPPACRFYPTCSHYSIDAIETHGAVKGGLLTVWRLLKCHPLHPGGFDPVAPKWPAAPARLWDGREPPTRIHH